MTLLILSEKQFDALDDKDQRQYVQRFLGTSDKNNECVLGTRESRKNYFQGILKAQKARRNKKKAPLEGRLSF